LTNVNQADMTFGSYKPLLNFSTSDNRASLLSSDSELIPNQETTNHIPRKKKQKSTKTQSVRFVKGQVVFHVPGYKGVQKLAATQLVKFVPINKLKTAAKRVLSSSKRHSSNRKIRQKKKQLVKRVKK
jgi:hypothetical protein